MANDFVPYAMSGSLTWSLPLWSFQTLTCFRQEARITFEVTMPLDVCGDMIGFISTIYLFLLRLYSKMNNMLWNYEVVYVESRERA